MSVVVTSFDSPAILRRCLASLLRQPEIVEIVVSDCSPIDPAGALGREFPQVRFLHSPTVKRVPALRWAALSAVSGEIIGALEARCVPAPDWARVIVAEHLAHPGSPAVGGPVGFGSGGPSNFALYWCEYGAFAPPVASGPAPALSGANLSYARAELDQNLDLMQSGAWETVLHDRWRAQGRELRLCQAAIEFHNTMPPGIAMRQRFHYGRGYAADRAAAWSGARRLVYGLLAPLLPLLLTARMARQAFAKGRGALFLRALGWMLALNTAWSAGEAVGYLLGADPEPRIF